MSPARRDLVVILLAIAGVLGAVSLAGIFVVYLVNTIGDNGNNTSSAQVAGTTNGGGTRGPSGPTGTAPPGGAAAPKPTTATPTPGKPAKNGNPATPATPGTPAKNGNPNALNLIPKNQQFATLTNRSAGYSIRYPKGWVQQGSGATVIFNHNNDFIRVAIFPGTVPSIKDFRTTLKNNTAVRLPASGTNPGTTTVNGAPGVHATVIARAVLQKTPQGSIRLVTDLYRFGGKKGKFAAIDIGTPDRVRGRNLDDYTKILNSFRWG